MSVRDKSPLPQVISRLLHGVIDNWPRVEKHSEFRWVKHLKTNAFLLESFSDEGVCLSFHVYFCGVVLLKKHSFSIVVNLLFSSSGAERLLFSCILQEIYKHGPGVGILRRSGSK